MSSSLPQQSDVQTQVIPRKAIYKTKGSLSNVIEKKELISYPSNSLSQLVTVGKSDTTKRSNSTSLATAWRTLRSPTLASA